MQRGRAPALRAFSSTPCRTRQPLFQIKSNELKVSNAERQLVQDRKRTLLRTSQWVKADSGVIRAVFHRDFQELFQLRSEYARRIADALAKLQDPASFEVKDLTFDNILGRTYPSISYPPEFAIIDRYNPLGIPPDTPEQAIPPIHHPSRVAKALSDANFTGPPPWPRYKRVPRGGHAYPPQLHIDGTPTLNSVTLTLPGATIDPLYTFFKWFLNNNFTFRATHALVTLWARSHGLLLSPQALGLMVVASLQGDRAFFVDGLDHHGWANVDYRSPSDRVWGRATGSVPVGFTKVPSLPENKAVEIQLVNFFIYWSNRLSEADVCAFSVRYGRSKQQISRQPYKGDADDRSNHHFLKEWMDDPLYDPPPWRFHALVIQDPFLFSHNHAENLSGRDLRELAYHMRRTATYLRDGRPLPWTFGTEAIAPGSEVEARLLGDLAQYSAALSLLKPDRIPTELPSFYGPDGQFARSPQFLLPMEADNKVPDPRPYNFDLARKSREGFRKPDMFSSRGFHTSSVVLDKAEPRKFAHKPPKPIQPSSTTDQSGWGLNSPQAHNPSFWRPGPVREPLTLPKNARSSNPLPERPRSASPLPPVRPTNAGVAYKSASSKLREFHTSASCAARDGAARLTRAAKNDETEERSVQTTRKHTLGKVRRAIQKACGDEYKVELFGSTRYGASSPTSDLDMVILDPHRPHGFAPGKKHKLHPVYEVRNVAKVLKSAGFFIIETLGKATVPIVKFRDPQTGHFADINVNDRLGLINSDFIKRYCELNPVLTAMIQYIKLWAKPLGLNNPSAVRSAKHTFTVTFSSYALALMTIAFMQHRGLLPNLQEGLPPLEAGKLAGTFWLNKKPKVLCCDVRYQQMEGWTPPEDVPLHQLIREWFQFYADFDYDADMISVREGGRLPRPPKVHGYLPFGGIMCNVDPFIRTKNITQHIGRPSIHRFKHTCKDWAAMPEFKQGELPLPEGALEKMSPELQRLMMPKVMRSAAWLPVEADAQPLPWRDIPRRPKAETRLDVPPHLAKARPSPILATLSSEPVPFVLTSSTEEALAPEPTSKPEPGEWISVDSEDSDEEEPLPDHGRLVAELEAELADSEAPGPDTPQRTPFMTAPIDGQDDALEYDPNLVLDSYGRIVEPKKPPKVRDAVEDTVGWGFR
ncbi:hypothetical protein DFH06DRAFT_1168234 [Mycena polygramma]|nr:hypothetical protein DFH06DRAFT_1168234 [Mycena polygramma]